MDSPVGHEINYSDLSFYRSLIGFVHQQNSQEGMSENLLRFYSPSCGEALKVAPPPLPRPQMSVRVILNSIPGLLFMTFLDTHY